jgi:hypothetical protein
MAFTAGLRTKIGNGFEEVIHAVQFIPATIEKNSVEAASSNLGTLVRASESLFNASIKRPGERGVRPGIRETGHFTFGTSAGGDFVGGTFKLDDGVFGMGWPNIDKADAATNYVWRSLEYGLAGTLANSRGVLRGPGRSRYPENQHLVPTGFHRMPRKYMFSSDNPRTSFLIQRNYLPARIPGGAGIEGKHFIEDAFEQAQAVMIRRYKKAVLDPVAAFGK